MPTYQQINENMNSVRTAQEAVSDSIRKQVMRSLGKPVDLLSVQVRPVGGERYRVNVVVGKDVASSRIANSFFLTADAEGNILLSSPKIVSVY
jgi:hypothetical protein